MIDEESNDVGADRSRPAHPDDAVILERLDYLADLFSRRLVEDRTKQRALEELQQQITRATESVADAMRPLVLDCIRIIDRIEASGVEGESLSRSVCEELELALARNGIERIETATGDVVDPRIHEVIRVEGFSAPSGATDSYRVVDVVRAGFIGGSVLRPVRVVAQAGEDR